MRFYLVTFHETDGDATTVYDTIVKAEDEDSAQGKVADAIAKVLDEDGQPYLEDGDFGFYFECDHDGGEDGSDYDACEGHGGIVMRDAEAFETLEDARAEQTKRYYHARFTV
jgi:hypothetical protein